MQQIILLIHVVVALFLIVLVLIQHGKGADIGAAFGSGASQTIFGSQGTGSFLLKVTCGLAAIFFATSLTLNYLGAEQAKQGNNPYNIPVPANPTSNAVIPAPATTAAPNITVNPSSNKNNVPQQQQKNSSSKQ